MNPSPGDAPADERTERYLRGELTAEEVAAFEQELRNDHAARARFRKAVRLDANLRALAAERSVEAGLWLPEAEQEAAPVSSSGHWLARYSLPIAAAFVVFASLALFWVKLRPSAPTASSPGQYVATLASARDCEWASGHALLAGGRLATGAYALRRGVVEIQFDGGAHLRVEGPADFNIEDRGSMLVTGGKVFFHSDASAEPFNLRTPRSVFLDLGTEYVAVVRPDDEELHVLNGEVRRSSGRDSANQREVTTAGMARRYVSAKESGRSIPFDAALAGGSHPTLTPPTALADALLAYDRFEYHGPLATGADRNGGAGWDTPWIIHPGLAPITFDDQQCLHWPGIPDTGGAVRTVGRAAMHRYLKHPIPLDRDGVHYFSFLFRRASTQAGDYGMIMLVLRKSGLTVEQEIEQQSAIKVAISQANAVASLQFGGSTTRASLPLESDTTYFLAGKIVASGTMPGQAFIRVYRAGDTVPSSEPSDWSMASEPRPIHTAFNQISLELNTKSEIGFDKFKIGESWSAIAP
ncbi:MAG: hypothetical protein P4L99_08120 [Chthoniobacter sp.]|nr:hypothetical protein [Chthoniobacter sp.]